MTLNKLLILLVIPIFLFGCAPKQQESVAVSVEVPDFTLKDLNGEEVTLSSFKGFRPVLLIFWATWCPYCLKEVPSLNALREKYSKDSLEIIGIDIMEPLQVVKGYCDSKGVNYTIVLDETSEVTNSYGIAAVPTLVVIDRQGRGVVADNMLSDTILKAIEEAVNS